MDTPTPIQVDLGRIAQDLQIRRVQVESVVQLLDEGNTVPFITRYRKERTGNLNEVTIHEIQVRVGRLRELAERKETILKAIEAQGKLTEDLAAAMHTLVSGVNANLSCTVSGDVITVASSGSAFDLYVTSLTLKAWLGLDVPATNTTSVSAQAPEPASIPKLTPRFQTRTRLKKGATAKGGRSASPSMASHLVAWSRTRTPSARSRPVPCRIA